MCLNIRYDRNFRSSCPQCCIESRCFNQGQKDAEWQSQLIRKESLPVMPNGTRFSQFNSNSNSHVLRKCRAAVPIPRRQCQEEQLQLRSYKFCGLVCYACVESSSLSADLFEVKSLRLGLLLIKGKLSRGMLTSGIWMVELLVAMPCGEENAKCLHH